MRTHAHAEDEISKELFLRDSSRGLYCENQVYKQKRSIDVLTS